MTRPRDRHRALHARLAFLILRLSAPSLTDGHRDFLFAERDALEWALQKLGIFDQEELASQMDKQRAREERKTARGADVVRMRIVRPIEGSGAA